MVRWAARENKQAMPERRATRMRRETEEGATTGFVFGSAADTGHPPRGVVLSTLLCFCAVGGRGRLRGHSAGDLTKISQTSIKDHAACCMMIIRARRELNYDDD